MSTAKHKMDKFIALRNPADGWDDGMQSELVNTFEQCLVQTDWVGLEALVVASRQGRSEPICFEFGFSTVFESDLGNRVMEKALS